MARSVTEVLIPLTVRDLTVADLPSCAWSGSATHLTSIAKALERVRRGEVDYLAVCPPSGLPESWDEQAPDGSIFRYETMCTLMRKELS